jgi:hypothetical protein
MILYLFLVVVGDREGRSFYADTTIMKILRLRETQIKDARFQLKKEGLIDYQKPFWWVKNIQGEKGHGTTKTENHVSTGCFKDEFSTDRKADRDFAKKCIKDISRILSDKAS